MEKSILAAAIKPRGLSQVSAAQWKLSHPEAAKEDLDKTTDKRAYEVLVMDTCDLDSVRGAVASLEVSSVDGLVWNAGGMLGLDLTADGVTTSLII